MSKNIGEEIWFTFIFNSVALWDIFLGEIYLILRIKPTVNFKYKKYKKISSIKRILSFKKLTMNNKNSLYF